MTKPLAAIAAFLPLLSGCGSLFESKLSAPQTYVLRLPRSTAEAGALTAGSVRVQRPEAGPGLDSNRIALLRTDRRFDYYAASLWAAPAPDVVESVIVDALRDTQSFSAVFDDAAPFAPRYDLRCTMRRFEADYTAGEGAPTAWVIMGSAPRLSVILNPSSSSLKTERSFFLMRAISSLMSFKSKVSGVVWVASGGCYGLGKNRSKVCFWGAALGVAGKRGANYSVILPLRTRPNARFYVHFMVQSTRSRGQSHLRCP